MNANPESRATINRVAETQKDDEHLGADIASRFHELSAKSKYRDTTRRTAQGSGVAIRQNVRFPPISKRQPLQLPAECDLPITAKSNDVKDFLASIDPNRCQRRDVRVCFACHVCFSCGSRVRLERLTRPGKQPVHPISGLRRPVAAVPELGVCLACVPTFTGPAGYNAYENALTSGSVTARICARQHSKTGMSTPASRCASLRLDRIGGIASMDTPLPKNQRHLSVALAWGVHVLTASGAVLALFALLQVEQRHWNSALLWLGAALVVDGIDGPLARLVGVVQRSPRISGATLDLVVDYLTYVFVPAVLIYRAGLLPTSFALAAVAVILVSSLYTFARTDMKTADNFFQVFRLFGISSPTTSSCYSRDSWRVPS